MQEIANHQLSLDQIPDPNAEDWSWFDFAHTFNGYEAAGSFAACSAIADRIKADGSGSLTELRCALFLSARSARHCGWDDGPTPEGVRHLIRQIRKKVASGDLD